MAGCGGLSALGKNQSTQQCQGPPLWAACFACASQAMDELLSGKIFPTLREAQTLIEQCVSTTTPSGRAAHWATARPRPRALSPSIKGPQSINKHTGKPHAGTPQLYYGNLVKIYTLWGLSILSQRLLRCSTTAKHTGCPGKLRRWTARKKNALACWLTKQKVSGGTNRRGGTFLGCSVRAPIITRQETLT